MFRRIALLALVSAFVAVNVEARSDVALGWSRIESENFEFVGNAGEAAMRKIAIDLERFRSALGQIFSLPKQASKTRVFVFRDQASFLPFKPTRPNGTADDKVAAFFIPGDDVNTIAMSVEGNRLATVYHEYVHNVVASGFRSGQIPPWLNEGLAEFFETFSVADESTVVFGGPRPEFARIIQAGPLIPWDEFFALDNFTLHQDSANVRPMFYAQAWAITSSLIGRPGEKLETADLPGKIKGAEKITLDKAVTDAIAAPTVLRRSASPSISSSLKFQELSEAYANAILGELLHRQRNSSAEGYLRKAVTLDPKLPFAYSSLGQLRFHERKFGEAKAFFERAAALDSQDYLVHFYSGFLLLRENLDAAGMISDLKPEVASKIRESVARSIALNPRFAESYNLLATVEAASGELPSAERAIRRAVELRPGVQGYSLMLAQVLLRQDRTSEAVAIARQLLAHPADSRIKAEAQTIAKAAYEMDLTIKNGDGPQMLIGGFRQTIVLKYKDLTPQQVEKIDTDRENYNYNVLVDRPKEGESHIVGYIESIVCGDGNNIEFRVRNREQQQRLTTRRFDDVRFRVAVPGTRSFAFRCGSRFPDDLALLVFSSAKERGGWILKAITFVPTTFKYLSNEEMAATPYFIIEGRPSEDISQNEARSEVEREAMRREMQETQLRDIEERLRQPQDGEERVLGIPERLECAAGRMVVSARIGADLRVFATAITSPPEVQSYNVDAPIVEVGCRSQLPALAAVLTFNKADSKLISIEFVPAYFKLR